MLVFLASGISACRKAVSEPVPAKVEAVQIPAGLGQASGAAVPTGVVDGLPAGMPVRLPSGSGEQPITVIFSFKAIADEAVFGQVKAGLEKTDGVVSVQKVESGVQVVFQMGKLSSERVRGLIADIAGDAEFARPNQCARCVGDPACSCFDAARDVSPPLPKPVCDCAGKEGCPCNPI